MQNPKNILLQTKLVEKVINILTTPNTNKYTERDKTENTKSLNIKDYRKDLTIDT